jgi:hypothetical protein
MKNGIFNLPKYRDKVQKKGSAIHPFSQNAMPISKLPHNTKKTSVKKSKNCKKRGR